MKTLTAVLAMLALITSLIAFRSETKDTSTPFGKEGSAIGKKEPAAEPKDVAKISVATWDDQAAKAKLFVVQKKGEGWTIPSAFDYPADAGERVGRTAGVLNVKRGRFVTNDAQRHDELGVIDPTTPQAEKAKDRGKKITIEDAGGAKLIDIIVGKPDSTGKSDETNRSYFVRETDSAEVFTAKLNVDISTSFIDWVKPDLLQISRDDVRAVHIHDYSVDENQGTIVTRSETRVARDVADGDWQSPQAPETKRVAKAQIDKFLGELTDLRLVGIRPFIQQWLQARGYFFSQDPALLNRKNAFVIPSPEGRFALVGNEGETSITTKNGITYHLFFGEIALGDDEDKEAGSKKKDAKTAEPEKKEGEAKPDTGHNRYLVVFASYDPSNDEDAKAAKAAGEAKKEGETPAAKPDPGKANQALTDKANKRFQAYFYVIANSSFESLRPKADSLWEEKPKEPMAGNTGKTVKQWFEENGVRPGVTKTPSGLQYEVVNRGPEGGKQPTDADQVEVRYKGTLVDGTEFDSGTTTFGVTGVIKGWTEALKLMHEGDTWKLFIPPELGYKDEVKDKIPPHSILIFEVELLKVK